MMNMDNEYSAQRRNPAPRARRSGTRNGGRFLKEQQPNNVRRRRRRRRLNPRFVILVAALIAILIGIILGVRSCSKPTIIGRWDLDGTTVYRFEKGGKGALVLMNREYEFNYVIEDNLLRIDFVDEGALDADYTFEVQKSVLFLTGGPGDAKTDFALTRIG